MRAVDVAYPRSAEGRAPLFGTSLQLFGQIHRAKYCAGSVSPAR